MSEVIMANNDIIEKFKEIYKLSSDLYKKISLYFSQNGFRFNIIQKDSTLSPVISLTHKYGKTVSLSIESTAIGLHTFLSYAMNGEIKSTSNISLSLSHILKIPTNSESLPNPLRNQLDTLKRIVLKSTFLNEEIKQFTTLENILNDDIPSADNDNLVKPLESTIEELELQQETYKSEIINHIEDLHSKRNEVKSKIKETINEIDLQYNLATEKTESLIEEKEEYLAGQVLRSYNETKILIKEKDEELSNKINELGNTLSSHHQKEIDKANQYLEEKKEEINKLVGIASETTLSGSYEKHAAIEAETADKLRKYSIWLMLVVFALAAMMFIQLSTGTEFSINDMFSRLGLFFVLSIPAVYLTRESEKHRQQELNFKKLSLDLKTINPFLSQIPVEQQIKIKTDIANRVFFAEHSASSSNKESYPFDLQNLAELVASKLPSYSAENKQAEKPAAPEIPVPQATAEAQPAVTAPDAPAAAEKTKETVGV